MWKAGVLVAGAALFLGFAEGGWPRVGQAILALATLAAVGFAIQWCASGLWRLWKLGIGTAQRNFSDDQRLRDQHAAIVLDILRRGGDARFALYLRPFAIDRRTAIWGTDSIASFEGLLTDALNSDMPVVCLGQPYGQDRPGAIATSDEQWQNDFKLLASQARFVAIVPLLQRGTCWEILWLAENDLLHKSVFLQPPQGAFFHTSADGVAGAFEISRKALEERGCVIPKVGKEGGVFVVAKGGARVERPFPRNARELRDDIVTVLAGWKG